MAYTQYPIEDVPVADLRLDVSNYRFPVDQPSEVAAMNYLFAEHGALSLAELILRDGYIDNEMPLVVDENGTTVILEGNRRLSALRALLDPRLVPARQAELERLLRRFAVEADNLPTHVRVMRFPSREDAAPVLARLHIGDSKKPWSLDEQAKFVLAQLTEGVSVQALKEQLPAVKDVVRLVRMGRVREMLKALDLDDDLLQTYVSGDKLAMSSFEYAYRNVEIQALLGIQFSPEGDIVRVSSTAPDLFALKRLLRGFMDGELNTRRGLRPGSPEFTWLLNEMSGEDSAEIPVPARSGRRGTSHEEPSGKEEGSRDQSQSGKPASVKADRAGGTAGSGGAAAPPEPGRRGPNDPGTKRLLDLTGIEESNLALPLKHRVRELRRIDVTEFPAAAAMCMRSVLEAAIKEHYGMKSGADATGMLSDVMKRVTSDYGKEGQLAHAISSINNTKRGASTTPGTGEWFNVVTHSVNIDVTGAHVHSAWRVVFPLVRFLLSVI